MSEYRSTYSRNTRELERKRELANLERELEVLRRQQKEKYTNLSLPTQRNSYAELDNWLLNKLLLIGGGIAIGIVVGYLFLNTMKCK